MIEQPALLVLGDFSEERVQLADVCAEFGWKVCAGREPPEEKVWFHLGGVLLDASGKPLLWHETLRLIRRAVPDVPVLLSHRFHTDLDGFDPVGSDVFDVLLRPLHYAECRQTLGHLDQHVRGLRDARTLRPRRQIRAPVRRNSLQPVA
jgi:hypothetical protein